MYTAEPPRWHTLVPQLEPSVDVRIVPDGVLQIAVNTKNGRVYQITALHPGLAVALRDWLVEHSAEYEPYWSET